MPEEVEKAKKKAKKKSAEPIVSEDLGDGRLAELVYWPEEGTTRFCVYEGDGEWSFEKDVLADGRRLVPYAASNNLLTNEVVLFPTEPAEYGSAEALAEEVRRYIHRYVHLSPLYEQIASYYVLLTWLYDRFNELPYLRVRGDAGTGKTRFLLTVGALCYKPIFASGASTVSPLFRMIDAIRGTLIIDEGDFRFSDERAEVVKILNNGNSRGFPVLRSEPTRRGEYSPTAYQVFGPKLVATRGHFEDRALETRCLTEEMGGRKLRGDVPINLPESYKREALKLRNKLLLFRFENYHEAGTAEELVDAEIEPRLNQIFVPLMSVVEDEEAREDLRRLAREYDRELRAERGMQVEARVLEVVRDLRGQGRTLQVKQIADWFRDRFGEDYDRTVTARWIGYLLRRKLQLKTRKSDGVYVIPAEEVPKLERLFEKYGVEKRSDAND